MAVRLGHTFQGAVHFIGSQLVREDFDAVAFSIAGAFATGDTKSGQKRTDFIWVFSSDKSPRRTPRRRASNATEDTPPKLLQSLAKVPLIIGWRFQYRIRGNGSVLGTDGEVGAAV